MDWSETSRSKKLLTDLRNFLLTKADGVFLDKLCHDFHEETSRKINFSDFGFYDLSAFISSIPKIARLECYATDKRMKVFGVKTVESPHNRKEVNGFTQANRNNQDGKYLGIMGPPGSVPQGRPGLLPVGQDILPGGCPHSAGGASGPGTLGAPGPFLPGCPGLPGDHDVQMNGMNCCFPPPGGRGGPGLMGPPGWFMPSCADFPMENDFHVDNPNFGPPRGYGCGMMGPPDYFMPARPDFMEDPSYHMDWCKPPGRGKSMMGSPGPLMPNHPNPQEGHYVQIGSPYCRTAEQLDFIPNQRGIFFLRFPARNKASLNRLRSLSSLFGGAGNVAEINETRKWIFVGYTEPQAVTQALKMFPHLGLSVYGLNVKDRPNSGMNSSESERDQDEQKRHQMKRTRLRSKAEIEKRLKNKKRRRDNSYRMYMGNLDPEGSYSFDMFRNLFKGYRLEGVNVKRVERDNEVKLFAYVLIPSKEKAIELCNKFNGYVWKGKALVMEVKEKKQPQQNADKEENAGSPDNRDAAKNSSIDLTDTTGLCESRERPGMEPTVPGLDTVEPGLEPF